MSSFTEPLEYRSTDRWAEGRRVVIVTKAFRYYVGREDSSLYIDVPVGFETDLGSIPRMFRGWISPDSPWASAYVVHDLLYRDIAVSRWMCDRILLEALGVPQKVEMPGGEKVQVVMPIDQRLAIYAAVRTGGWRPYRQYAANALIVSPPAEPR